MDVMASAHKIPFAREVFSAGTCFMMFIFGLPFVTEVSAQHNTRLTNVLSSACSMHLSTFQGGPYLFQIFDYYVANGMALLTYCFTEAIAIAWIYGINK